MLPRRTPGVRWPQPPLSPGGRSLRFGVVRVALAEREFARIQRVGSWTVFVWNRRLRPPGQGGGCGRRTPGRRRPRSARAGQHISRCVHTNQRNPCSQRLECGSRSYRPAQEAATSDCVVRVALAEREFARIQRVGRLHGFRLEPAAAAAALHTASRWRMMLPRRTPGVRWPQPPIRRRAHRACGNGVRANPTRGQLHSFRLEPEAAASWAGRRLRPPHSGPAPAALSASWSTYLSMRPHKPTEPVFATAWSAVAAATALPRRPQPPIGVVRVALAGREFARVQRVGRCAVFV
jgi:hypothetical protein